MRTLLLVLSMCMFPGVCLAGTIHVPSDQPTIQAGIDAAVNGDTVLVSPGTYIENIDFLGKAITVSSRDNAEATVIDGRNPLDPDFGSVVTFRNNEGVESVLDGFTITNGPGARWFELPHYYYYYAGGIFCKDASPTISNNVIIGNNTFLEFGGGIYCEGSSPMILNNTIAENAATMGGGIVCYGSSPTIINNVITENWATYGGGINCGTSSPIIANNCISWNTAGVDSGGIKCHNNSTPTIVNNMIHNNSTGEDGGGIHFSYSSGTISNNSLIGNTAGSSGGGIYCFWDSSLIVTNSILWDNDAAQGPEIYLGIDSSHSHPSEITISYSDVEGGQAAVFVSINCTLNWGNGMIDVDPLFVDPSDDDFHLTFTSPCIDAGDHEAPSLPATDFEGDPRIAGYLGGLSPLGGPPPAKIVDMGADEYYVIKKRLLKHSIN